MRSPVPGQSPEGEKVSDSTPLLQGAPQAEAGEPRRDPGASGGRPAVRRRDGPSARALGLWGEWGGGEPGVRGREDRGTRFWALGAGGNGEARSRRGLGGTSASGAAGDVGWYRAGDPTGE